MIGQAENVFKMFSNTIVPTGGCGSCNSQMGGKKKRRPKRKSKRKKTKRKTTKRKKTRRQRKKINLK